MDFTEKIMKARPHLKPNSAKAYATSLRLLAPPDPTDLGFLKDTEAIIAKLSKYKTTTRRNYLNAVIVVLKGLEGSHAALETYEKLRDKYNDDYAELVSSHTKTDRQKELWIEWPDFLALVEKLREQVSRFPPKDWTPKQAQVYQDYLLALFYSKYPLRNDLADTKVVGKAEHNALTEAEKKKQNFVVRHDTNKYTLVLNEYKTARKYGEKRIELEPELLKPLR
eukprot:COSAG04_NODE_370_length_15729_cov_5.743506_1_plen_223_part_10